MLKISVVLCKMLAPNLLANINLNSTFLSMKCQSPRGEIKNASHTKHMAQEASLEGLVKLLPVLTCDYSVSAPITTPPPWTYT